MEYYPTENLTQRSDNRILINGCITEKLILTVDVLMSQTTPIKKLKNCHYITKSDLYSEEDGHIAVKLLSEGNAECENTQCNFLCKWFTLKNNYLLEEIGHLKQYLNNLSEMFFHPEIEIRVRVIADREIPNDIFDYLRDYVDKH